MDNVDLRLAALDRALQRDPNNVKPLTRVLQEAKIIGDFLIHSMVPQEEVRPPRQHQARVRREIMDPETRHGLPIVVGDLEER